MTVGTLNLPAKYAVDCPRFVKPNLHLLYGFLLKSKIKFEIFTSQNRTTH